MSNCLQLLALVWFVSSVFLYSMELITPISSVIWTFEIANPCFFSESGNTASIYGPQCAAGPYCAAGTHHMFCGLLACSFIAVGRCRGVVGDLKRVRDSEHALCGFS